MPSTPWMPSSTLRLYDVIGVPSSVNSQIRAALSSATTPATAVNKRIDFIAAMKKSDKTQYKAVCHTVREDGYYFEHVPLFGGKEPKRVINDKGKFGDANDAVIEALIEANALVARGRLRHQYRGWLCRCEG